MLPAQNLLTEETSPYLLQHKDNPVHWRPWSNAALEEARREDKPILLSVGYAACHWCHVMAHESFENEGIARLMNDLFVNIKLDREERPDLDHVYQTALALMGQQGGWPLTIFLTPDGEPFWGGTYFPAESRFGRPAFPEVLQAISQAYHTDKEKVDKNVTALRDALSRLATPQPGGGLSLDVVDQVATTALRLMDPVHGGTAGAPKFPQPTLFRFLWRSYKRTGDGRLRDCVIQTVDAMCQGGIYDHLGGGFARYSTDERWLAPHFEKMLYDNALLIELLTEVWLETRNPLYAARIRETVDWALREMRIDRPGTDQYAFASAIDADSEGLEGKYYVWTETEIDAVLGDDAGLFNKVYDVSPGGNWEGHTILNRSGAPAALSDEDEHTLAACRAKLLDVRRRRVPPERDDKVLADWNGLMIAALADAAAVFRKSGWLDAAKKAFSFVTDAMDEADRLRHVWCAGVARHGALIEDYANMARAALALHQATGDERYLERARTWVCSADRHHWDEDGGGYFHSADDTDDVIARSKTIADNAVPSGNGTMVEVLARLHYLTGEDAYRDRCAALVRLFSGNNAQYLIGVPGFLTAFDFLERPNQIAVIGEADRPETAALLEAAFLADAANKIVSRFEPGTDLPASHPARGKTQVDGRPTAYVCLGPSCLPPVTDAESLQAQIAAP